ncbi:MAG: winged helix-turn-helix domain-containing protein, partial [Steroidobacteraceae bacterium]
MARVRMIMRRGVNHAAAHVAVRTAPEPAAEVHGAFRHDAGRRQMSYSGVVLELTLHEYRLLEVLLQHPGRVYTRAQLLELAWEAPDHRLDRTVDSHIKSLRAKLREVNDKADPIHTHRGMGYSLDPAA